MSHQVHYHQHGRQPIVLHVVKDNKDGTFDLGYTADGPAKIEGIRISDTAGDGCATPVVSTAESAKGKGKGKKEDKEKEKKPSESSEPTETESGDKTEPPAGDSTNTPPPEE